MLELKNEKCTGCEACTNICEYDAIQMHRNKEGFLYPIIDYEKCIKCNKCQSVCPLNKNIKGSSDSDIEVYAMKSKNKELRIHSTSGGAFSELAQIILNDGGSVAGAVYKQDWSVKHKLIGDINQLELLRRSKYQQSEIGLLYREIETKLNNNFKVLFCGAPCQAAGLKCYLNKDYDNLYICDFICRGVPSPGLFQAYLKYLKEIYGSEITSVWMKNKRNGWHSLTTVISFLDGNEYVKDGLEDSYVQLFLKYNIGIRPCCYKCKFKNNNSVADITLGDFWGLDGTELDDNLGTSAIICRTRKGMQLFNRITDRSVTRRMDLNNVKRGNQCYSTPVEKFSEDLSESFFESLEKYGYKQALQLLNNKNALTRK